MLTALSWPSTSKVERKRADLTALSNRRSWLASMTEMFSALPSTLTSKRTTTYPEASRRKAASGYSGVTSSTGFTMFSAKARLAVNAEIPANKNKTSLFMLLFPATVSNY